MWSYLDIREVGPHDSVHDTPHVGDGVLVTDLDTKLLSDQALGTLTTEQVLRADGLNHVRV